jgi:hypothetical protein
MSVEKFLKQSKQAGPTPTELWRARAFAEKAADAQGLGPRGDFTESTRESVRKYCAARNRN